MNHQFKTMFVNHHSIEIKQLFKNLKKVFKNNGNGLVVPKYFYKQVKFLSKTIGRNDRIRFWFPAFSFSLSNNILSIPAVNFKKQVYINEDQYIKRIQFQGKTLFLQIKNNSKHGKVKHIKVFCQTSPI